MTFNSFIFILLFLPISVVLYYLGNKLNKIAGKIIVVVASAVFYAYSGWKASMVLGISLIANYLFAILIKKAKKWYHFFALIPIVTNIALLLYFKYRNFVVSNLNVLVGKEISLNDIVMPLGISFFTFHVNFQYFLHLNKISI